MTIALITAGGTREPIDAVRHITNVATGSLPAAMADALLCRGVTVHYLHGPGAVLPGQATASLDLTRLDAAGLEVALQTYARDARRKHADIQEILHLHAIGTAQEAMETLERLCRDLQPDLVACAMAVADYAPVAATGKLASQQGELVLRLAPTAKAIDRVRPAAPHCKLLGFKLLAGATEAELLAASRHLLGRSGADLVFANDITDYRQGLRRGLLVAADGTVLARLDGGHGEPGLQRLAGLIVQALV
jgi:phosphopantothenoylcysteine synthetase/decarboxylase